MRALDPDLLRVWATTAAPRGALAAAGYQPAGTVAGVPVHGDEVRVVWPVKGGLVWAEPRPTPDRLARLVAASQRLARP